MIAFHKHAPIQKKNKIRKFDNIWFMSKVLRKTIKHRSKLKNIGKKKDICNLEKLKQTTKVLCHAS